MCSIAENEEINVGELSQFLQGTRLLKNHKALGFESSGTNDDYMRMSGASISIGDLNDLVSLDDGDDDKEDEFKTAVNEYENNINELSIFTTKEEEISNSNVVESDELNIQEDMRTSADDLFDFKLDDALAEIDNVSIEDDNVKFTEAIFDDDLDEKKNDVTMTSLTHSMKDTSITKKNRTANASERYDDKSKGIVAPSSPVHLPNTTATEVAKQQDEEKERDLINFQYNLNGKLEELVQSMKRTEESRHMLARHACRRNSMGSPGLTAYNTYINEQQQQYQQQAFHQSFTAPPPPQYQQHNLVPEQQQTTTSYPKYDTSYNDGQYNNYNYGYQQQHQYAYNHPPKPQTKPGKAMRRRSMY